MKNQCNHIQMNKSSYRHSLFPMESVSLIFIFGCTQSLWNGIHSNINMRDTDSIGTKTKSSIACLAY